MDYEDEDYSSLNGSADLFDDVETDLTTMDIDDKIDSKSLKNINNEVTAIQAQNSSQLQELHTSSNTLQPTLCLFSDKSDTRIALLDSVAEESNNKHFNVRNQPVSINGSSLDDSFQSQPNKRHKLCECVGEVLDGSNVDTVVGNSIANCNIVSNHSSDKGVICAVASQIAISNKNIDNNVDTFKINFASSSVTSLNKNIVNVENNLETNIDSDNIKEMAANNSDFSTMNSLNQVSLHQEMMTDVCGQDFERKVDSSRSLHLQTPGTSQTSPSDLQETAKIICPFCYIQLDNLKIMEFHIDSTHSEVSNDNNTEAAAAINNDIFVSDRNFDFQFICPLCDFDLGDRVTLDLHRMTFHENEHSEQVFEQETCPLCGMTSVSEKDMKLHIQTHSSDQTVYGVSEDGHGTAFSASRTNEVVNCPVCDLAMTDSDLLISHVESHFNPKHKSGSDFVSGACNRQNSSKEGGPVKVNAAIKKDLPECQKARASGKQNNGLSSSKGKWTPKDSRENLNYKNQYEHNSDVQAKSTGRQNNAQSTGQEKWTPNNSRENLSYKNQYEHNSDVQAKSTGRQNNAQSTSQEKWTPNNSRENLSYKNQYEHNSDVQAKSTGRQNNAQSTGQEKWTPNNSRENLSYKNQYEHNSDVQARSTGRQNNAQSTGQEKWTPNNSRENLSYKRQYEQNLERAVTRGQMSVADYHEQKQLMAVTDLVGVDNGNTRTTGLIEKLKLLYRNQAHRGQVAYLCSPTDHFSGSYGDKGWGCGYRNFQMILSCLTRNAVYAQRIFTDNNISIPSIPKIQQLIASAWEKGFDAHGCAQFGGCLVNTSRWIGATEIVAVFSSLGIKCLLADFHAPSAPDGTHPVLLEWVSDYFCNSKEDFIPPLYLQHQGHSRTIIGVEKEGHLTKLLLFDPGTPRDQMISIARDQFSWKHMQSFRRTQNGFRAKQYQVIAIVGLLTEKEYEESKILKSVQVS